MLSIKVPLRLSSKCREENMENQVISTFGSAIWILVQVACIAFTAFCAILLGAIQLERAKGAPVHPRATDWTVYLLLVIIAGCGLITLMLDRKSTRLNSSH